MKSLARFAVRRRWFVLVAWIAIFVGVSLAANAQGSAYSNSFSMPGTGSINALHLLEAGFPHQAGDQDQIVYYSTNGPLAADQAIITKSLDAIRARGTAGEVGAVVSPFCPTGATLKLCPGLHQLSPSGTIGYATIDFTKNANELSTSDIKAVIALANSVHSATLHVAEGGGAITQVTSSKGTPGEGAGLLLTLIILLLAFGSLLAAALPLGVALFAIGIATGVTELLSHAISIPDFAPILGSLIGLGVGIDYALFIVTRTRQNLLQGMSTEDAVAVALNTSGRAVLFAGATVCVALLGMLFLGFSFLNGLGLDAAITVVITVIAAVTLLPALLGFLKSMVLSRKERRRLRQQGPLSASPNSGWVRWAAFVRRNPRTFSLAALVAIVAIALPVMSLNLGMSDAGSDPSGSTTRVAYDLLAKGFGAGSNGPLQIVGKITSPQDLAKMQALDKSLPGSSDIAFASPVVVNAAGTVALINVIPQSSPQSTTTTNLISRLRSDVIPTVDTTHTAIYVGGARALADDFAQVLDGKIPLFLGIIIVLGCLLLMVAFRSVLVPLVAAVMNLLAVAAAFGVVVAVFQWGWGASLLQSGTGPVESYLPTIMIAILFGLSMDYQVFLVSRMHEEWTHSGNNEAAIETGQGTTGRVITAAALIMISVFLSFAFGGQRIIAEFGVGLGGAVLIDAFLIRTVLVPSLMHFLGNANWWMPQWLDRIVPHLAVEASDEA